MIEYKKCMGLIRSVIVGVCIFFTAVLYAQEAESLQSAVIDTPTEIPPAGKSAEVPVAQNYRITAVHYNIKGLTRKYPLSQAVPVDTDRIFTSEEALQHYLDDLKQQFKNIRVIQSVKIDREYGDTDEYAVIPVVLTIAITDTWNFIAVPYPSFDSNSGFQLKLKMQDFNFAGTLQPLKADLVYRSTETDNQILSSSIDFSLPFKAGVFNLLWDNNFEIVYAFEKFPKINIGTGLAASHKFNKHISLVFGLSSELAINDRTSSQISATSTAENSEAQTETVQPTKLGYLYPNDRYYFKSNFYLRSPIMLAEIKKFGALVWTPSISLTGNWAFDGIQANDLRTWSFNWGHALSLSRVNWQSNFRKGLSFSISNTYAYQFYSKHKMTTDFKTSLAGYYSFINRVGIYGRAQFFYLLFGATSTQAGSALRGILNKRIDTDTAFTFNFDIPIRIATLDFQTITGVSWVRLFNCDIQFIPFFDMALVHDSKTGRYYHPADGWYAGGMEVIVYPEKMRSIYVRASLGVDLTEVKNLSGLTLRGKAKRDGESITEIFIGIGVHY